MQQFPIDYPIEYIKGKVNFFGKDFFVSPDVLIPRLETESLVRKARQILGGKTKDEKQKTVIDIGCGSGIIGTSVADLADEIIFIDISPAALKVAEKNFRTYFPDKKAQFIISDLLSNLSTSHFLVPHSSILFLSNLPYIKDEDWKNMSSDTVHEPRLALFGGEKTGFELYERLLEQLDSIKLGNCNSIELLYEFGFDQRETAERVVKKYSHWEYSFFTDYAGMERFGEVIVSKYH